MIWIGDSKRKNENENIEYWRGIKKKIGIKWGK